MNVERGTLYALTRPVLVVCFAGTLITDFVYWQAQTMLWANMSAWLLLVGVVASVLAVPAELTRRPRGSAVHVLSSVAVLVLSIVNCMVHTRDAYTSVVPTGLTLSLIVVIILAATGWQRETSATHGVA
jgi:uncharacterized membrane protein